MSEHQFDVGDIVKLQGYKNLFEIIGYFQEIMMMDNEKTEEITYSLRDIGSGCTITRGSQDLQFIRKGKITNSPLTQRIVNITIDDLLDKYNDLMELYKDSNDNYYNVRAQEVLRDLKEYYKKSSN